MYDPVGVAINVSRLCTYKIVWGLSKRGYGGSLTEEYCKGLGELRDVS